MTFLLIFLASLWAGTQNALAGGGAFILLPTLMLTGMDARAANITLTIALFPAQVTAGWAGRRHAEGAAGLSFRTLTLISLLGGALGAALLLVTSSAAFARLIPWLVLLATAIFAWGSFRKPGPPRPRLHRAGTSGGQLAISIYGGYFGGGIGFLMLAALTAAGVKIRTAAATKNVLAAAINASAVMIFVFSPAVRWQAAAVSGAGAVLGALAGGALLNKLNERVLRIGIVVLGAALSAALFVRGR